MRSLLLNIFVLVLACTFHAANCQAQEPLDPLVQALIEAAIERTTHDLTYDGSYRSIGYPAGDVPDDIGVCTDLVVRSFRVIGVDLQRLVHEDMTRDFDAYPGLWGHRAPDTNIDHRRVPNLQTFLKRQGAALVPSEDTSSYRPGDLVTWLLPGNLPHIGIVTDRRSRTTDRPLIAHNIGYGPDVEDILFSFEITGHYRYLGPR